ncbi:hypothetical protein [Desulfofustis glycolicus]|uniref:hypothetical protein n=1 Tax=Desulfofustis glycolicus TaxID=51195 RepID=UPI0009352378|nr:hypothetical protein [Desulfofustis glycolicus]
MITDIQFFPRIDGWIKLNKSEASRGGATSTDLNLETKDCSAIVGRSHHQPLSFMFHISSAGGGLTRVHLGIDREDLLLILTELAGRNPTLWAEIVSNVNLLKKVEDRD